MTGEPAVSRLVLVSGSDRALASEFAEVCVSALRTDGAPVALVSAADPPDPCTLDAVAGTAGMLLAEVGADPVVAASWSGLVGLSGLSALLRAGVAMAEGAVVVVDAGDARDAVGLVQLPGILLRLLDAALTPRLAMWRGPDDGPGPFDACSSARLQVLDLVRAIESRSSARLVSGPDLRAADRAISSAATLSMLGVPVSGVALHRWPRKSEGASGRARREAEAALAALRGALVDIPVWKSPAPGRAAPKGRSAADLLDEGHGLRADRLEARSHAEQTWDLDLALLVPARERVQVGVQGDQLVLGFDGAWRWLDLPPVLRRCAATQAVRTAEGLRVRFEADPSRWPVVPEHRDAS